MHTQQLSRLKSLLAIPTCTYHEHKLVAYIIDYLKVKGYTYDVDPRNNIFITKGSSAAFPLVVAHLDTVHGLEEIDVCHCALELLESIENIKVALFVEEEVGCYGSENARSTFFSDVIGQYKT